MRSTTIKITLGALILCLASASAFAQGRGRGGGLGRKADVFTNGHDGRIGRINGRGRTQDWRCGVFVNCHDARDGRWDGRGPGNDRVYRNSVFTPRSSRVGYQRALAIRQARFDQMERTRQERLAQRDYLRSRAEREYLRNRGLQRRPWR